MMQHYKAPLKMTMNTHCCMGLITVEMKSSDMYQYYSSGKLASLVFGHIL